MTTTTTTTGTEPTPPAPRGRGLPVWAFVTGLVIAAGLTLAVVALLHNISTRKAEARDQFVRVVEVGNDTTDPSVWGRNWPRQYDAYKRTVDMTHTRYGGSEGPIPESRIERDPWLKRMFAGYAFAIDFRDRRGHAYMLYDQEQTLRVADKPQGGACLHCHASVVPTWRRIGLEAQGKALGEADGFDWAAVMDGFVKVSGMTYVQAHAELLKTPDGSPGEAIPTPGGSSVKVGTPANKGGNPPGAPTTREALASHVGEAHPVSCVDCHDPDTMALRVTRPGFVNGIRALADAREPDPDRPGEDRFVPVTHLPSVERWRAGDRRAPYDPNADASRQEMRSFVCGQCHVEYYCATKETLFFPWHNGLKMEQQERTYEQHKFPDGSAFFDFKHAETGAPVFKAQHPEFEMWSQGVHARSGVSCADCHMPYVREGAQKVSDHWVRSPLLQVNRACQTCHNFPEAELLARVRTIQDRTHALMDKAGAALDDMFDAVRAARDAGVTPDRMGEVFALQRQAQWRLDFVNAENSMGFHAPQEAARILGESIDYARQAQVAAERLRAGAAPGATAAR